MSVESFIRAMPKVELNLRLEGAVQRETMLMLADQNEIRDEVKKFEKLVQQYKEPDFKKIDELLDMLRTWIRYPDDLARAIYDIGVSLSKDNVRYAEIAINPMYYVTGEFTFEDFINAINDGRDRVERAWGVQMRWVMMIPRDEPRWADDIARWATSATARRGGVVGLALSGYGKLTPLDSFERAFRSATKKDIARLAYLHEKDDVDEAIALLNLNAVIDAWGITESPETIESMQTQGVALYTGVQRALAYNWVKSAQDYPLAQLADSLDTFVMTADMPVLFGHRVGDEYLQAVENEQLTVEQIQKIALATLQQAHLPEEEKEMLQTVFQMEYDVLAAEHLAEE